MLIQLSDTQLGVLLAACMLPLEVFSVERICWLSPTLLSAQCVQQDQARGKLKCICSDQEYVLDYLSV